MQRVSDGDAILLSARRVQLLVQRDDDKCNFQHPSECLTVETRPIFLEERRCALRLVQDDPELRWIFEKPDLSQPA